MSKYIKLEDAIEAYNQAVTLLVESEMEEFNLSDFTECSFNTTQIKLIARMIESLPTIEVSEDTDCMLTMFGECSYNETGCGSCAVAEKIRKALSAEVSEDCISKHDIWKIIEDNAYWVRYNENLTEKGMTLTGINQALNECPPVIPTVSEDCSDYYKGYCARYENGCFHQCKDAPSVVPTADNLSAVEDCISRAEVLSIISDCQDIEDKAKYNTLAEVFNKVLDAPSVVPNCSEKPNNCETCANGEGDIEACGYCRHGDLYEPKDEQSSIVDIVTCEECKRCKKGLVIERRADEQETIVNLCNRTKPPTMVSLDFYCKDGERIEE